MSKKLTHEKEIEKARLERKWKTIITLVSSLNIKNVGGALTSEEVELSCCFYLGEAGLDDTLETHFEITKPYCISTLNSGELEKAYSYLSAAATAAKKSIEKHPHFYQDSHLLLSKYHFILGEYQQCVDYVNNLELMPFELMSIRSKIILSEALTCKGLALEKLDTNGDKMTETLESYEKAGEVALSICIEEEKTNSLKRSGIAPSNLSSQSLAPLLETCLLRPGEMLTATGLIERAIHNYRSVLRLVETKATFDLRKMVCRRLAELLLSFSCPSVYSLPSFTQEESLSAAVTPTRNNPESFSSLSVKASKQSSGTSGGSFVDSFFCPSDDVEESVLVLLLSEAMITKDAVCKQTEEDKKEKLIMLNETKSVIDLLIFALTRCEHYKNLSQCIEAAMELSFGEFELWYQFGLSLTCAGQHARALLIFEQCSKLCPDETDVLMLCSKICINNLQRYEQAIGYAEKALSISKDCHVIAGARLAIGMSYNHLALAARSPGEKQRLLQLSMEALIKANLLDPNDTEILFHLGLCQALSKQINVAITTIERSLTIDPTALSSLYLLSLLLSAEKKHDEALDIVKSAIIEYPHEFGLQLLNVKLTELCWGTQVALNVCHNLLSLWNDLCSGPTIPVDADVDGSDIAKSNSFSKSLPKQTLNDSKLMDNSSISLKKVNFPDGTSVDDDGAGSIAASIFIEKALSEAASGMTANIRTNSFTAPAALLAKLWLVTAECFIKLNDTTEASGCILEASAIFPLSPDVLYMRGRLNELQRNVNEAKACYESAIAVLPTHVPALQRLGMIYHDSSDDVIAEKMLRDCILLNSSNHTAWNDLGLILETIGHADDAATCFITSLKLELTSPILPFSTIPRLFKARDTS